MKQAMTQAMIFEHQDGVMSFAVNTAAFSLSDSGHFACSMKCYRNEEFDFMANPCFAIHDLPVEGNLTVGQVFFLGGHKGELSVGSTSVHCYCGEHYTPWNTTLEVLSAEPMSIELQGSFRIQDPNYYDERAKDTLVHFRATFARAPESDLWNPL